MTTNERGGATPQDFSDAEDLIIDAAAGQRKPNGVIPIHWHLLRRSIAKKLESTRRAAIAEAMESEVVKELAKSAWEFREDVLSGAPRSLQTRSAAYLATALEKLDAYKASLSENQTKGKGE